VILIVGGAMRFEVMDNDEKKEGEYGSLDDETQYYNDYCTPPLPQETI
jgi:hypothetical protein